MKKEAIFEKRKWVGITNACNNKCAFCLDGSNKKQIYKSTDAVTKEFKQGRKQGCTRLILSGGEATIHPDFIEFIRIGKRLGYKKIQVITNGRMFSYHNFLKLAIKAGLNEITFSIHGHNAEIHDGLTLVNGSFKQTIKATRSALKSGIIVSCDIVINKKNIRYFPEIMNYLLNNGVREFDLLYIVPFGNAWKNNEILFEEFEKDIDYIKEGINIGKNIGAVIWTNRLPPEYLEGYEEFMQDPYKMHDDVRGRNKEFNSVLKNGRKMLCYGKRCEYCWMKELCEFIFKCNDIIKKGGKKNKQKNNEIVITKNNYNILDKEISKLDNKEKIVLSLVPPYCDYQNYDEIVPKIKEIKLSLYNLLKSERFKLRNIPPCFIDKKYRKYIIRDKFEFQQEFLKNDRLDLIKCASYFIGHKKIKGIKCKRCTCYKDCDGIFQKYIMKYGFKELRPIE